MRILFITATRIGDAILTTGLLDHLVRTYPEARFTIACGPVAADLFRAAPHLERLLLIKKRPHNGHWIDFWKACIGTKWDLIIDLRNSLASRLLWTKERHCKTFSNTGEHKVEEYAKLLKLTPPPAPKIWVDDAAREKAADLLPNGPLLALGPSANWAPKQWPIERFVALAQKLTAKDGPLPDAPILVPAASSERDQLRPLREAFPRERLIELTDCDLLTVAACLARAALFVGNDSGLSHIAAAMGTPTLALFGPGWEKIYGPWGPNGYTLRSPVSSKELWARLPEGGANEPNLMQEITTKDVLKKAEKILAKNKASAKT